MLTELWELIRRLIQFFWHMPPVAPPPNDQDSGHSSSESPLGNPIQNEEPRDIQSAISDEPTLNLAASSVRAMPLSNHNASTYAHYSIFLLSEKDIIFKRSVSLVSWTRTLSKA